MKKQYYVFYNGGNTCYDLPPRFNKEIEKIINQDDITIQYIEDNTIYIQLDNNTKIMDFVRAI